MFSNQIISLWDWLLLPFYLAIIYLVASNVKNKRSKSNPAYAYFISGLFVKILGAISLCFIYVYYYSGGGDTLNYNYDSSVMLRLLLVSPEEFFSVLLAPWSPEMNYRFSSATGYPIYGFDPNAFMVVRLLVPVKLLGLDCYVLSSVLMAVLSYTGIWKLYLTFCDYYPQLYKKFAIPILFIPSVFFWGSGLLKDSWTIGAAGWFTYAFYNIVILRKSLLFNTIAIIVSSYILLFIKPYIFIAIMPGCLIWGAWDKIVAVKSVFLKLAVVPFILVVGMGTGYLVWSFIGAGLGDFSSLDSMIKKARVSSDDLKQAYYQGNSFDLGEYEPTIQGVFSKFPAAVTAGLFRPFIWEAKNVVMILAGLENLIILGYTLVVITRNPRKIFVNLLTNPLVLFCLIFSVFFAFSVAISTSNFGALVRLRIPLLPFYLAGIIVVNYLGEKRKSA